MLIRECTVADYRDIWRLNQSAFGYAYDCEKTKARLDYILNKSRDKIFVACAEDTLLGYVHGSDYECTYSDSLKNIMAIAVDETHRGSGIGKALLLAIENWAREDGCGGVRLVSGLDREKAHGFYLHNGYTNRKLQKNFIKYFSP